MWRPGCPGRGGGLQRGRQCTECPRAPFGKTGQQPLGGGLWGNFSRSVHEGNTHVQEGTEDPDSHLCRDELFSLTPQILSSQGHWFFAMRVEKALRAPVQGKVRVLAGRPASAPLTGLQKPFQPLHLRFPLREIKIALSAPRGCHKYQVRQISPKAPDTQKQLFPGHILGAMARQGFVNLAQRADPAVEVGFVPLLLYIKI